VDAEAELRLRLHSDRDCYAVPVSVQQLDLVDRHFGTADAECCLSAAATRLARLIQHRDRMYRWGGETLLLLLDRQSSLAEVVTEVRASLRALPPVRLRNSVLRLRCVSSVFPLGDFTNPASLIRKIELAVVSVQG